MIAFRMLSYEIIGDFEYAETGRMTIFGRYIRETWFRPKYSPYWRSEETGKFAPTSIHARLKEIGEAMEFRKAKEKAEASR